MPNAKQSRTTAPRQQTLPLKTLKVEIDGAIGRLTLNRPDRLNAINGSMLQELAEAARWFDSHHDLRVVIISGAGRAFTAGADLQDRPTVDSQASPSRSWLYRREVAQAGLRATNAIEAIRAVTIAQVHGYCVGGGVVLLSACDFRIVAADTSFFIPEIEIGIPLSWGAIPRMVHQIGSLKTKELVMTCRRFTPDEAHAIGFINRVVPPGDLEREVNALAADLVAKPSVPITITKDHVNSVAHAMSAGMTAYADGDAFLAAIGTEESTAAAQAYFTKTFRKSRPRS